jgi:DNA (cytosine-5)-methyltransferase 3A
MGINVLSLFDGMSCGQQALERAGIEVDNYFASEIDKYAIKVTMANYPNTQQLGSVVAVDGHSLPKIDLLIGGSPCQSFSFAGKRKGMSTKDEQEIHTLEHYLELKSQEYEFEGQSYLFWEYMRLLSEVKPKYFLLENVMMGEKWERVLSKAIGVKAIMINSSIFSAQNRQRLYWTNIGMKPSGLFGDLESFIKIPKDKGILLKDILQDNPNPKIKLNEEFTISNVDSKYFLSNLAVEKIKRHNNDSLDNEKSNTIHAGYYKQGGRDQQYVVQEIDEKYFLSERMINSFEVKTKKYEDLGGGFAFKPNSGDKKSRTLTNPAKNRMDETYVQVDIFEDDEDIIGGDFRYDEGFRWRENGKSPTLTTTSSESGVSGQALAKINKRIRRLTPIECERLQTVKDNYTAYVSDSQRYRMLGNGWTVDVIAFIFSHIENF